VFHLALAQFEKARTDAVASRRSPPRCPADAHKYGIHVALLKACEESAYSAHRLLAGKTATKRRKRRRPASQAAKLFENRRHRLFKASTLFLMLLRF
jgi:hypothetical protein